MVFHCANEETARWLQDQNVWKTKDLKAVQPKDFPEEHILVGRFKHAREFENDCILGVIQGSNENLNTKGWRIIHRKEETETATTVLTMEADHQSVERLKESNMQIDFAIGQRVELRLIKNKANDEPKPPTTTTQRLTKPSTSTSDKSSKQINTGSSKTGTILKAPTASSTPDEQNGNKGSKKNNTTKSKGSQKHTPNPLPANIKIKQ
jgi:hypothetical protein